MWIGIDGEGKGRSPHRYTLLAASDEFGGWSERLYNPKGLSTKACLDFIVRIPAKQAFSFAFNYDLTKMLADIDDHRLYYLMRPELRQSPIEGRPPIAIKWNEFTLNLQGTKFSVKKYGKNLTTVWDIFRFFQCKFTKALRDWKILPEAEIDEMEAMKNKRGDFDQESDLAILEYCLSECRCMGQLAHALTKAHDDAQVTLKNYFGAGSTGAAILDDMAIKQTIKRHIPYAEGTDPLHDLPMGIAVMCGFFGGRFENSVVGPVRRPIYSADISSAYPYQLCFLPCLEHGQWRLTTKREEMVGARAALVNWSLGPITTPKKWGPFPFRTREGSILFPVQGGSGWVYKDEFLAGEKLFDNVRFESAWILEQDCDCRPFPKIPHYYRERVRIGKNGPGIVFKLGPNSCYGKLAQSVGKPQYQCWLWAGMITSGCRAQILELMGQLSDVDNVLAIATDGIYTLEEPPSLKPLDTETWETKKPLGGWEIDPIEKGMFFARPGINFPLDSTAVVSKVRGRGFGRKSIYDNREKIEQRWADFVLANERDPGEYPIVNFPSLQRFIGAKSATRRSIDPASKEYAYRRDDTYGEWVEKDMKMSFNPAPKRAGFTKGGTREMFPLGVWTLPAEALSTPYKLAVTPSEEERVMEARKLILEEQPEWTGPLEG